MPKSVIEQELLDVSGFEPKKSYKDRQDYLGALARAVQDVSNDDFDTLSDAAADWHGDAVDAINDRNEIPDFPDLEADAEPETKSARKRGKAAAEEDEPVDEAEADDAAEEDGEADEADGDEAEEEPPQKPGRSRTKPAAKAKDKPKGKDKEKPTPKKDAKGNSKSKRAEAEDEPAPKAKRGAPSDGAITLDRYGIAEGTKNAQAVAMLEKGAKMSDVNSEIGGTYYNLLKRLVKQGHTLEREPGGKLRLVHKDDGGKPAKGKGKK